MAYSMLIHILFNSYSFPMKFLFMSYSTLIQIPFIPIHFLFILVPFISKVIHVINKGGIKIRAWVMFGYNQQ